MIGLYSANSQSALGFTGLLDEYGGAAAAYSVRRLSSSYSGSLIEVRRSSDNTTQDIDYDANGELDTTALLSFVGAGDGFVRTWYDQSGNGNNAQQTTTSAQTRIVASGVLETENSISTLNFDVGNVYFNLISDILTTNDWSIFQVAKKGSGMSIVISNNSNNAISYPAFQYTDGKTYIRNRTGYKSVSGTLTTQCLQSSFSTASILEAYRNGTALSFGSLTAGATTANWNAIGKRDTEFHTGNIQELIIYKSNQSSNRTGIETNINSYFSIY